MNTFYKLVFVLFMIQFAAIRLQGQVAISNDGSQPHSSAMLEIKSTDKGLLLPRLDYTNRPGDAIAGLLVYFTQNAPYGSGLYLFDGNIWLKIGIETTYIGQAAYGGVVFYVDSTGQHGMVATATDLPGDMNFGCDTTLIGAGAQYYEFGKGDLNTAAIVAGCSEPGAARACSELDLNGYSDWFLPSKEEQDSLMTHRYAVGGFEEGQWYWSSMEIDAISATMKINDPGMITSWTSCDKAYLLKVRCIRKF